MPRFDNGIPLTGLEGERMMPGHLDARDLDVQIRAGMLRARRERSLAFHSLILGLARRLRQPVPCAPLIGKVLGRMP